jgi:CubicO group peptidase (beta-lactamase class C family)
MLRPSWISLLLVLLLVACSTTPTDPAILLQQATDASRAGQWDEAVRLSERALEQDDTLDTQARCEALWVMSHSKTRLGQPAQARATLSDFEEHCADALPPDSWLAQASAELAIELGMQAGPPPASDSDGFWQTADATAAGVDATALAAHEELCAVTFADACVVVYQGQIVQEWYGPRYLEPMHAMSSTKSITALLVALLIEDGAIPSLDTPVCDYIDTWCAGERGEVTIHQLLAMTSGLPQMREGGVGTVSDKNAFVATLPLATTPGTTWAYSNEGVQLLSPILDAAAGEPIQDYAARRLFEPLGMEHTQLKIDSAGHAWTYADMETTPRDMARIGLLMLNEGTWQGEQIIDEAWVAEMTRPSQQLNPDYGLLWWLTDDPPGFVARGYLNTNLYVFPESDLIVVRMQRNPGPDQHAPDYEPQALDIFDALVQPDQE